MEEDHMPNLEELMEAIKNMKGLSDEDREELMQSLSNENKPGVPAPLPEPHFSHQTMVLTIMLLLVVLTFESANCGDEVCCFLTPLSLLENFSTMSDADVLRDLMKGFGGLGEEAGLSEENVNKAGGILKQLINGYGQLNEEDKAEFRNTAQDEIIGRMQEALSSRVTQAYYTKLGILAACVLVLLFVFVFFGYKLIKSIKEKEKKKEEKKKQKQSKKKK